MHSPPVGRGNGDCDADGVADIDSVGGGCGGKLVGANFILFTAVCSNSVLVEVFTASGLLYHDRYVVKQHMELSVAFNIL